MARSTLAPSNAVATASVKDARPPPAWLDQTAAANGRRVCENFAAWFAGSKVLQARGEPATVFHGSKRRIDVFNTSARADVHKARLGAYFTSDQRVALHYGRHLHAVHLRIVHPFDIAGMASLDAIKMFPVGERLKQELRSAYRHAGPNEQYGMLEMLVGRGLRQALEAAGFDGIKYTEAYADSYIAFRPEQVKSATANSGLFDATSPSLTDSATALQMERAVAARQVADAERPRQQPL